MLVSIEVIPLAWLWLLLQFFPSESMCERSCAGVVGSQLSSQ